MLLIGWPPPPVLAGEKALQVLVKDHVIDLSQPSQI